MSNSRRHPVVRRGSAVREADATAVEVIESTPRTSPFFSFHYSSTEVSAAGGRTRVKSRQTRLEDGKLTSETFEGELDGGFHARLVRQAQEQFVRQAELMLRSLGSFLLPFESRRKDRD